MTWALLAVLVIVTLFAIGEAIFIRHLIATMEKLDEAEKPAKVAEPEVADRGRAMVDLLCASIVEKPEQWSFKQGVLEHNRGTAISLTEDGQSVQIKRGKDISIVGGSDGLRIREAVLTRNLRVSFEDIAKELV